MSFLLKDWLDNNLTVKNEFIKRLGRGDTPPELAKYLKTTKWPGSIIPSSVSAFIIKHFPTENKRLLYNAGYPDTELQKLSGDQIKGLKERIKIIRKVLIPHLRKYDRTGESVHLTEIKENLALNRSLSTFRKEKDPRILDFIKKELQYGGTKQDSLNYKKYSQRPRAIQEALNTFIEKGFGRLGMSEEGINALNWIGNNSSKFKYGKVGGLNLFIKDYEKKFGKIGSDPIFSKGEHGASIRINLKPIKKITAFPKGVEDLFSYTKGFSEPEIFKSALVQNNRSVRSRFKKAFDIATKNRTYYAGIGLQELLNDLREKKLNIFGEFDLVKGYPAPISGAEYGGVHHGVLRSALKNSLRITDQELKNYQFIRKPLTSLEEIVYGITGAGKDARFARKTYGLTGAQAREIGIGFAKLQTGRNTLDNWLTNTEKLMGGESFHKTLGKINFEHNIAKSLGMSYKYLPRDYLLRGQYAPESFNLAKRDVFDTPLIKLMKKYTETGEGEQKIKNLIRDFNKATKSAAHPAGYAGDLVFDKGGLRMLTEKADVAKYADPKQMTAVKEYLKASQLGPQLKEFAPKTGSLHLKQLLSGGKQIGKRLSNIFTEMSVADQGVLADTLGCIGKAEGGRIGYALGTGTIKCVNTKLNTQTLESSQKIMAGIEEGTTGVLGKIRNTAKGFLGALGRFGPAAGKFGAFAAVGALAQPLVKQFRNDDPFTYLTDPDQQAGMLEALIEGERPKPRSEILDTATTVGALGATAAAVPGTSALWKARRLPTLKREAMGMPRAALGPAMKLISGMYTPAGILATEPLRIAQMRREGESWGEVAKSPTLWMGPAFADTMTRMATRGMRPGSTLSKALSLGMSRPMLKTISRKFGMPGLALSLGLSGYDMYKDYKKKRGFFARDED